MTINLRPIKLALLLLLATSLVLPQVIAKPGVIINDNSNDEKYDPNICKVPKDYRKSHSKTCKYISEHCSESNFAFAKSYYCSKSSENISKKSYRILAVIGIAVVTIALFLTLGLIASNFVSPNLLHLTKLFGMNEEVAGLTLLSLGNSSPDLFSTYAAMSTGSTSLAMGELIGSATFACSMVLGMMIIVSPFKVNKANFLRDVLFFSILIVVSLVFLNDGKLTVVECICMLLMYIFYMTTVIRNHYNRRYFESLDHIEAIIEHPVDALVPSSPVQEERVPPPSPVNHTVTTTTETYQHRQRGSYGTDEESNMLFPVEVLTPMDRMFVNNIETYEKHIGNRLSLFDAMKLSLRTYDLSINNKKHNSELHSSASWAPNEATSLEDAPVVVTPSLATNSGVYNPENITSSKTTKENAVELPQIITTFEGETDNDVNKPNNWDEGFQSNSNLLSVSASGTPNYRPPLDRSILSTTSLNSMASQISSTSSVLLQSLHSAESFDVKFSVTRYLFPAFYSVDFKAHPYETLLNILSSPLIAVLNATIPVPLEEIEIDECDMSDSQQRTMTILFDLQIFFFPYILANHEGLFEVGPEDFNYLIYICCVLALIANVTVRRRFSVLYNKHIHGFTSLIGFISCLIWITNCASYVVRLMKNIGVIYNIEESLLGLTLLSLGNSVGDLVANCTLAACGFQLTALSACLGSPLLYILVGIGVSGIVVILKQSSFDMGNLEPIEFKVDPSFYVSSMGLVIVLIFYSFCIPMNDWNASRYVGVVAVMIWVSITTINVLINIYN